MEKIVIVGAGLVGSLLSIYMARAGYSVYVYDKNPDPRQTVPGSAAGQSVNITLCQRGFQALEAVDLSEEIRRFCIPLYQRVIHSLDNGLIFQPYGNRNEALFSIERKYLLPILLEAASSYENIHLFFNQKCLDVDLKEPTLKLENLESGEISTVQGDRLFAADGAYSTIRMAMLKQKHFNYSQEYNGHGYKEIYLDAKPDGTWRIEKNGLHIWPRTNFMLLGFPNIDGSFTLSLHLPFHGAISHESIQTHDDLRILFETYFPDIWPFIKNDVGGYFNRPPQTMITVKCFPWTYEDKVALIGDSCHAIFPYYGQGTNAGFEDCQVLLECIKKQPNNWLGVFQEYELLRKANMDVISELCVEHLHVLSQKLNDSRFILKSRIERKIQELYPEHASLYHNISFTCMPYTKAVSVERDFHRVVERLLDLEEANSNSSDFDIEPLVYHLAKELQYA